MHLLQSLHHDDMIELLLADGQGDHSWGRGEVREGAAGEGEGPRGGWSRRWQRQHSVGSARHEAAMPYVRGRGHGEQPWR